MAPTSMDRRTRFDVDIRALSPEQICTEVLPPLVERNGTAVAEGIAALDAPPLTVQVDGSAWTLAADDGALTLQEGTVDGALVLDLDEAAFSDWAQLQRSLNGMVVMQQLRFEGGDERDVSVWDALWHTLLEGWPVVDPDLAFVDRHGAPLDLGQSFGPDEDPADIAHFLREAGFLHLRGWLSTEDMATIAADIERAVPTYAEGDGRSWWAVLDDDTRRCVRLQQFLEHSPTTAAVLGGDRWEQLRTTLQGHDQLVGDPSTFEALIKPVGVVQGASDLTFHRDCHLGRHPYGCSGTTVGISVTGSDEANGRLRVVAGSHRVAIPVEIAKTEPYLPVVAMSTEPGDLTVHLSCTLHEAEAPKVAERMVMYGGFSLAPREGDRPDGSRHLKEQREQVPDLLLNRT